MCKEKTYEFIVGHSRSPNEFMRNKEGLWPCGLGGRGETCHVRDEQLA